MLSLVDSGILKQLLVVAKETGYSQEDQVKVEEENESKLPNDTNNNVIILFRGCRKRIAPTTLNSTNSKPMTTKIKMYVCQFSLSCRLSSLVMTTQQCLGKEIKRGTQTKR